jgi:hypothetical protein
MSKETMMKRSTGWLAVVAMVAALGALSVPSLAQDAQPGEETPLDAQEILDRVNAAWQGDSFHGTVRLEITIAGATKLHALEVWTLGEELALIRVLEPEIDKDSGYLQLGDELWYYAPGIGSIKLPAMAIGDALFGAGPSLSDVSHGTLSNDYDVAVEEIGSSTNEDSEARWFLTLVPHLDAPVVFGQLEILVTADFVMETMITYDQRGEILQTAVFSGVIELGDRKFATTIVIEDSFGDQTIQQIENPQFDLVLDAGFFSIETFEAWGDSE